MINLFWKSSGISLFSWLIKLFIWWGDKRVRIIRYSKIDWDCILVEFTVDNLKVLTFNWDCTLVKSEHQQINWDFTWINSKIYNNNLLSYNL